MKTQKSILTTLNKNLKINLTLINQYFLHSRMLNNWGYDEIAQVIYKQSIIAMKQSDILIKRIFFLEGLPNLQDLGKLKIGENIQEIISADLSASNEFTKTLRESVIHFEQEKDYVSREILTKNLDHIEAYIDILEEWLTQIENMGIVNFTQSQLS